MRMSRDIKKELGSSPASRENITTTTISTREQEIGRSNTWGCCSGIKYKLGINGMAVNSSKNKNFADYSIIHVPKFNVPKKFQDKKWLKKYLDFYNGMSKHLEIHLLGFEGGIDVDKVEDKFKFLGSSTRFTKNDYIFAFKMAEDGVSIRMNLFGLSVIRYLQFARYWFYVNDVIELRDNEDLEELNNYEISQLCNYTNCYNSKNSSPGVYYYKSPFRAETNSYYIEENFDKSVGKLSSNDLNHAFNGTLHIYDIRYMRDLFARGEYVRLYNLLVEKPPKITSDYIGSYFTYNKKKTVIYPISNGEMFLKDRHEPKIEL